jgi:hypothetical protein
MGYDDNMAAYDAECEKEGLVDLEGAKSKEAIKDWWSRIGGQRPAKWMRSVLLKPSRIYLRGALTMVRESSVPTMAPQMCLSLR